MIFFDCCTSSTKNLVSRWIFFYNVSWTREHANVDADLTIRYDFGGVRYKRRWIFLCGLYLTKRRCRGSGEYFWRKICWNLQRTIWKYHFWPERHLWFHWVLPFFYSLFWWTYCACWWCRAYSVNFFSEKMSLDPMRMFKNDDHDWWTPYDFHKITLRQKRELIDMVFNRQLNHIRLLHSGKWELFELTHYRRVYEEKGHHIVFN